MRELEDQLELLAFSTMAIRAILDGRLVAPGLRQLAPVHLRARNFCDIADEDRYLELRQLKDIKSEKFYDEQNLHRRYFYYIDLQGRLFLENTRPKNIATSLKSGKFLRFFFSQVRPNRLDDNAQREYEPFLEYPYRSPCGKEMNFIKCADRPLVFEDLRQQQLHPEASSDWEFVFGGGELTMPFRPDALKISLTTGRLYHDVETKHFPAGDPASIGLVRSQLAVELGRTIHLYDDGEGPPTDISGNTDASAVGEFEWEGVVFPIRSID